MRLLFIVLVLFSVSVQADEWTSADTYRETAFQALHVIDWGQTRYIVRHPDKFHEHDYSGLIGRNPTSGRIDAYMAEFAVFHFLVSYYLPSSWRSTFQYITIAGKLNTVIINASIGIKIQF